MNTKRIIDLECFLESTYGLIKPEIDLIRVGGDGNETYRITAGQTSLIARIYGEQGRKNPDWARYELEMIAHLVKGGIDAAAPLEGQDGQHLQFLPSDDELPIPVALFGYAEGGVEWPTSPSRSHTLGSTFAQLHLAGNSFSCTAKSRALNLECLIHAPLRRIRLYLTESDPEDCAAWETLSATAEQAAVLLTAIPDAGGATGPIHGDLHQGNCHFNSIGNTDQLCFFDFSNAGVGWRVYDLSGFLWPLRDHTILEPKIREACDAFMEGYRSTRPLLPEEEAAVPACVKVRDLWETGCWLEYGVNLDRNTVRSSLHSLASRFRKYSVS